MFAVIEEKSLYGMCLCREGVIVYGESVGVNERRERWVALFICVCLERLGCVCVCMCMGKDRCVCV